MGCEMGGSELYIGHKGQVIEAYECKSNETKMVLVTDMI
jgi:hypothetical protein